MATLSQNDILSGLSAADGWEQTDLRVGRDDRFLKSVLAIDRENHRMHGRFEVWIVGGQFLFEPFDGHVRRDVKLEGFDSRAFP